MKMIATKGEAEMEALCFDSRQLTLLLKPHLWIVEVEQWE